MEALIAWGKSKGSGLHTSIEAYQDPATGLSLRVRPGSPPVPKGTQIVSCAYSISLSYFNAISSSDALQSHSSPLPTAFLENGKPDVVAKVFLMQQFLLGKDSFWAEYVSSLPQPKGGLNTPMFWSADERAWLEGTNLELGIQDREKAWRENYDEAMRLLGGWEGKERFTWDLYLWSSTIFSSRSFISALLPLEVIAGEDEAKKAHWKKRLEAEGPFPVLFPVADLANHAPAAEVTWDSKDLELAILAGEELKGGNQVYNNYGPKRNSELILGYGFALDGNDEVGLAMKTPPESILTMWKKMSSYRSRNGEAKLLFQVRAKEDEREGNDRVPEFRVFEEGLLDLLACMVANERERKFLLQNERLSPERTERKELARNRLRSVGLLCKKLAMEREKLEETAEDLGTADTPAKQLAKSYRAGQIRTLDSAIASLQTLLSRSISAPVKSAFRAGGLLTFQDTLAWLGEKYPAAHEKTVNSIAKILEDDIPLDLPALYPEWGFAIWTLFVHVLLSLLPDMAAEDDDDVIVWAREMKSLYGAGESFEEFSGEDYEEEECRGLVLEVGGKERDLNLASRIVAEEALEVETWVWGDWEDAEEKDGKEGVEMMQLVLCLGMLK